MDQVIQKMLIATQTQMSIAIFSVSRRTHSMPCPQCHERMNRECPASTEFKEQAEGSEFPSQTKVSASLCVCVFLKNTLSS